MRKQSKQKPILANPHSPSLSLFLCLIAEKRFNQVFFCIVRLGLAISLTPYFLLDYDAHKDIFSAANCISSKFYRNAYSYYLGDSFLVISTAFDSNQDQEKAIAAPPPREFVHSKRFPTFSQSQRNTNTNFKQPPSTAQSPFPQSSPQSAEAKDIAQIPLDSEKYDFAEESIPTYLPLEMDALGVPLVEEGSSGLTSTLSYLTPSEYFNPFFTSDQESIYLRTPEAINPNNINPFSTTVPVNDLLITHLTRWEFQVGDIFGEQTTSDPDFNSLWKINSEVNQLIRKDKVVTIDQRGEYVQLRTVRNYRQVTTTETTPVTILGAKIQLSLTGNCLSPNSPPGSICTFTPGLELEQSDINAQTGTEIKQINNTSTFGDIVTPESLVAIKQPGFQSGANGQKIGINLFLSNTGTVIGNSQASQATLTREEQLRSAGAASYIYTRQIVKSNAEKSVIGRTVRGIPFIDDEKNTLVNPALSLINLLLPDVDPELEASEDQRQINKQVSRNLFLAANNSRLPALSFVIYQAGLGEAVHPAKGITSIDQIPEGTFNGIWFGLSPVIYRREDVIQGSYNLIGPQRTLTSAGGEGGGNNSPSIDFSSIVNNSNFSALTLTNPYTQVYFTLYGQEANVTVQNIYKEETHYYPHLSFTGNITDSNSVFRYYGGIIASDAVKPYVGVDYNQDFSNWNYSVGGIGYVNPDRDYYSQLNGRIAYRFPLEDETKFTLYSGVDYALQNETRVGDTVSVTPLSAFSTGFRFSSSDLSLGLTNFVGLDNLENNSLSKMLVYFSANLTDYLSLGGYIAPYDNNPSRTQYGLNLNLNLGQEYNSPQLSFSWGNYQYRYGQDNTGNNRSVYDNVFGLTFRMGQPGNPFKQTVEK